VEPSCEIVRQALDESGGDPMMLGEASRRHLAACRRCAREAAAARRLRELLDAAVPPADPVLRERIMARLPARSRVRLLSLVPAAVGGLLLAGGAAAVGGVPGAGLAAMAPGISVGAGLAAAGGIGGLVNAGAVALQAIHTVVPRVVPLVAGGAAGLGAALIALGARRLGRSRA